MTHNLCIALVLLLSALTAPAAAQTTRAEAELRAVLALDPNHDRAREALTVLLMRSDRPEAAAFHAGHGEEEKGYECDGHGSDIGVRSASAMR